MRFTILREEFLKGLSTSNRAVGGKASPVASLVNLKIELNDYSLLVQIIISRLDHLLHIVEVKKKSLEIIKKAVY